MKPRNVCEYCGHKFTKREITARKKIVKSIIGSLAALIIVYAVVPAVMEEVNEVLKKSPRRKKR